MGKRFAGQLNRSIHRPTLQNHALYDHALPLKRSRGQLHRPRRCRAVFSVPNEQYAAAAIRHGLPKLRETRRFTDLRRQQQAAANDQCADRQ